MKWHGLRIPVIVFCLLLGLALFFSGQWLYQKYNYQQPLEAALSSSNTVKEYKINKHGEQLEIKVRMSTPNLMEDYKKLNNDVTAIMGKRPFVLELEDNRDKILTEAYYKCQYAIYQAISRGTYQEMAAVIGKETGAAGIEAKVFIDEKNIYLQMKHDGHELNKIFSRNSLQPALSALLAGGVQIDAQGS